MSSFIMSQDPLEYLPVKRWSELQSAFRTDWPRSVAGYTVLDTQRNLKEQGLDYGFKVYCPFGDVWNGMVAVNIKNNYYEIIIQCPRDDTQKLEDALRRTKVINWKRSITIPFATNHLIECIRRVATDDFEINLLASEKFVLDKPKLYNDVSLSPGLTFDRISLEHVELVDSTWPHRYPESSWYFRLLINAKYAYGLFDDNNPIAWVFYNEYGTLLHMFTTEKYRRKGYAELLLKLVINESMKEGKTVIVAFCVKDNINACNLYSKVGFTKCDPVAWCYLNKVGY